jgi:hypothetical protein
LSRAEQIEKGVQAKKSHRDRSALDDLAGATLHVDYQLPGWLRWAPPPRVRAYRPSPVRERWWEMALHAARRIDPRVEEAHIVPTRLDVTFIFTPNATDPPRVTCLREDGWLTAP